MRPQPRRTVALATGAIALAACVTTGRLLESRGEGESRCFAADFDALWQAIERALPYTGLEVQESDPEQRWVIARNYQSPSSQDPQEMGMGVDQGERVAVFVDSAGVGVWAVEVVSRRYFALDVLPRDWTEDVFEALADKLPESAVVGEAERGPCAARGAGGE